MNLANVFEGTVLAYGQTNSGKTHTMRGSLTEPGIISLAVHDLFDTITQDASREFLIRMSYLEIYNEDINDLLDLQNRKLQIHENLEKEVFVAGLREDTVDSPQQVLELLKLGESHRHIGETNMNQYSSRSHTILRMIIESREKTQDEGVGNVYDAVRISVLNLVDLAGSERAAKTGADQGVRLKEGTHINKSLLTLGTVIEKLSEGIEKQGGHIPYRDSKLTRILQPALGGNANTAIICNITLALMHANETKSSLQFASRALRVANSAHVNELLLRRSSDLEAEMSAKLVDIEKDGEVERMTTEMSELHKSKRQLMELLEQKDAEISEKNSTIKSYLDKIVKLTETCSEKESRLAEASAELARSQAMCSRLSQEKELTERHAKWLDEKLTAKVDGYAELRRSSDLEAEMSAKLVDIEKDGEVERMTTEMSELHKSKRQRMELLEQKDAEISEKNSTILDKIVKLTDTCSEKESRLAEASEELARSQAMCSRLSQQGSFTIIERMEEVTKNTIDGFLHILNTGSEEELIKLKGFGKTNMKKVLECRLISPITKVEDLGGKFTFKQFNVLLVRNLKNKLGKKERESGN